MIKWCSYCQRYLGELEPLASYKVTHGICRECMKRVREGGFDDRFLARIRALGERIMASAFDRVPPDIGGVLCDGRELGLRPVDLAVGVLQPSLYRVGELWASGEITVADEHRFTAFAKQLLDKVCALVPDSLMRAQQPSVLLARAEGNEHDLGVRLLGLQLASEGISSRTLPEAIGSEQVLAAVRAWQPKMLGLSISMVEQVHTVESIAVAVRAETAPGQAPEIVAGGLPYRNGYQAPMEPGVQAFRDAFEFVDSWHDQHRAGP